MSDTEVETPVELPHRAQVDPIVGYKKVKLGMSKHKLTVSGEWRAYESLDQTAVCHKYPKPEVEHMAPDIDCTCGLYGYNERKSVSTYGANYAIATVEAFGFIIMHETGYKASRQRISLIELGSACEICDLMNDNRRIADAIYIGVGGTDIHHLCAEHGEMACRMNAAMRLSVSEISDRLGVPVTWELLQ